jgi:hypothetical protein
VGPFRWSRHGLHLWIVPLAETNAALAAVRNREVIKAVVKLSAEA